VLAAYDDRVADFAIYRRIIQSERQEFLVQAARALGGMVTPVPAPSAGSITALPHPQLAG